MNADIPYLHCWVDLNEISSSIGKEEGYAFAIQSIQGRSLGFHVMLKSGAHYRNVPLHAITTSKDSQCSTLPNLAYWDCFSSKPVVTVFSYLQEHECYALLPHGTKETGVYLFTVDWLPDDAVHRGFTHQPDQNKCGHVIALSTGALAMLPTNKIAWRDGYFCGADPHPEKQGYKTQSRVYQAESCERDFSKSELYFY